MSWLRSSPLRQSFNRNNATNAPPFFMSNANSAPTSNTIGATNGNALRQRPIDTATDCDPRACYDSFCKHWQQAYDIIQRAEHAQKPPNHDEVLAVVSHLDFMVTLLLVELHHCNKIKLPVAESATGATASPAAPCLEYMLSENLLYKLYEWGCNTGRYANAVLLEQLKLYELLVSHSRHQLLCHEPFLRPLLKILAASQGEIFPPDLEKRLVILLNQLCVVLMQNVHLLDLFFFSAAQEQHNLYKESNNGSELRKTGASTNFIIFSLLIPYVHRAGSLGHQARDALLLCMALSQKNSNIGTYIAQYSSMCPLLVTGLGGLYSRLPNSIEITSIDWHRITPDDVTEIPELTLFMNALEFCNAVVQVAHDMIKSQLLDFMYQGFIVPVLGPAILQTLKGKHFQTNVDSQISAMSYLDLILRSVTEADLLRLFVRFLLDTEKFDGERIIDILVERLSSNDPNLCMVTMALFDTLLGLHCEDLMLDLLLKYMLSSKHVPISYRHKINRVDPYIRTADYFLELTPDVMKRARELTKHKSLGDTVNNSTNAQAQGQHTAMMPSPTNTNMSKTIGANWNYYGLLSGDSLYSNFHAYLFEAHQRIAQCQSACSKWRNTYKYQKWPAKTTLRSNAILDMVKQFFNEFSTSPLMDMAQAQFVDSSEKKQLDSLQSIGESSGYESFKWRPTDEETEASDAAAMENCNAASVDNQSKMKMIKKDSWRISQNQSELLLTDLDLSEDLFAQGTVNLGPFLSALWGKLQTFTSNSLYVNLHLTGLITRLAWYPLPLIHSILLRPDIVITSDTPSFLQMLRILKQQIDAELPVTEFSLEIVDVARSHLIDREFRLLNARKANENSPLHVARNGGQSSTYANLSANSPMQLTPSSNYDPFKRADSKRKSISKSISSMFNRSKNASSGLSQIYAFFTGASTSFQNNNSNASQQQTNVIAENAVSTNNSNGGTDANTHETSLNATTVQTATATTTATSTSNSNTNATELTERAAAPTYVANYTQFSNSTQTASLSSLGSSNATLSNASSVSTLQASNSLSTNSVLAAAAASGGSEPVSLESLPSMGAIASTSGTERTRDLALCAVLLDEWLKELAAIAQEQSIVLL